MTSEWSDLSVGVLEGQPDWNVVIVRTQRGSQVIESARMGGWLEVMEMPKSDLAHLILAAKNKKKRAIRKVVEQGLANTEEDGRRSVLRIASKTIESILNEEEG